jgi:hypothetical protein
MARVPGRGGQIIKKPKPAPNKSEGAPKYDNGSVGGPIRARYHESKKPKKKPGLTFPLKQPFEW